MSSFTIKFDDDLVKFEVGRFYVIGTYIFKCLGVSVTAERVRFELYDFKALVLLSFSDLKGLTVHEVNL